MPFDSNNYVAPFEGGFVVVVNGARVGVFPSQQEAEQTYNYITGQSNIPARPAAPTTPTAPASPVNPNSGWTDLVNATMGSNREYFDFEKQKWTDQKAQWQQQYQLAQSEDQRAAARLKIEEADAKLREVNFAEQQYQFDQTYGLQQQQQYGNLASNLLGTAAGLTGPRDWQKYLEYTQGGQDVMGRLYGSQPVSQGAAPTGYSEKMGITDILDRLGISPGTAPGGGRSIARPQSGQPVPGQPTAQLDDQRMYLGGPGGLVGKMIPDSGPGAPAPPSSGDPYQGAPYQVSAGLMAGAQSLAPQGYQVNPIVWDSMGKNAKQYIYGQLEAGKSTSGYQDPNDWLASMNAARPKGVAPKRVTTSYGGTGSIY